MLNYVKGLKAKITQEHLFIIGYSIYITCLLLELSMYQDKPIFNQFLTVGRYFSYAILFCKILIDLLYKNIELKVNLIDKNIILKTICFLSLLIYTLKTKDKTLIFFSFIIFSSYGIDFKKINRICLYANIIVSIFVLYSVSFNVIDHLIFYRESGVTLPRYSLGFTYPLDVSTIFFFCLMMYIYKYNGVIKKLQICIIILLNLLIYILTDGRTAFYLINLVILFLITYSLFKHSRINQFFLKLCCLSIPVISIASIFASLFFNYENKILVFFNNLLSNRIVFGQNGIHEFGITFFGQNIEWIGFGGYGDINTAMENYNFVDNSYLQILLQYGVLILSIIVILYTLIMIKSFEKDSIICYILFFITIYCAIEPRFFDLRFNPFILMFVYVFIKQPTNYQYVKLSELKLKWR